MTIKTSQLKNEIKAVVREALEERSYQQLLKEVSPPGAKAERQIQHVKDSLRDSHPNWSEDKITSVAIATAWKHRNKKDEQVGADVVAEASYKVVAPNEVDTAEENKALTIQTDPKVTENSEPEEDHDYDEQEEIKLLKVLKKIVDKLNTMHKGMNEASYKQVSPNETDTAKENKPLTIQTEPKVTENHKVQHRSYKTSDDMDNKPENVIDPEVPQA